MKELLRDIKDALLLFIFGLFIDIARKGMSQQAKEILFDAVFKSFKK